MNNIAMVVGNGFSIGFNQFHDVNYNTLEPLSWDVKNPEGDGSLLSVMPTLNHFIDSNVGLNDFDIFELALNKYCNCPSYEHALLTSECRHYLTLAFSQYSLHIKSKINKQWPWYDWISKNKSNIRCISSFNYDLLIEYILKKQCISFYDAALPSTVGRVMLHKPHGSCNFDAHPRTIFLGGGPRFPLRNCNDKNDTPFIRLDEFNLSLPRLEPMCVIPNEHNIYLEYQRMKPHDDSFHNQLTKCNTLIIIGHSYSDSDRPEIDRMLHALPPKSNVIICNPRQNELLNSKINEIGLGLVEWKNPLGPINEEGQILVL